MYRVTLKTHKSSDDIADTYTHKFTFLVQTNVVNHQASFSNKTSNYGKMQF